MRSSTAFVIIGGGVAALWAIASVKNAHAIAPGSNVTQDDVNASILKSLADIQKKQQAGKPLTLAEIQAKQSAGVQLTQDEINALMRAAK